MSQSKRVDCDMASYEEMSREGLLIAIRNLLKPKVGTSSEKRARTLDFSSVAVRRVALLVMYAGAAYEGFASQPHTEQTVEGHLFRALNRCCLIGSREGAFYNRAGRTDKGVSATGQVVALNVRSKLLTNRIKTRGASGSSEVPNAKRRKATAGSRSEEAHAQSEEDCQSGLTVSEIVPTINADCVTVPFFEVEGELDYVTMLNKNLPLDIRVVGWSPVAPDFNARFGCKSRSYRYFFLREHLDIEAMKRAAEYFVGDNDFRNFCKMDIVHVRSFRRRILSAEILPVDTFKKSDGPLNLYEFRVKGYAFLWHQIRCMVAVLFLVGRSLERPEVVLDLLDVSKITARPNYRMAPEQPLVLSKCEYEGLDFRVPVPADVRSRLLREVTANYTREVVGFALAREMFDIARSHVEKDVAPPAPSAITALSTIPGAKYTKLLDLQREDTYEERVARLSGRRLDEYNAACSKAIAGGFTRTADD